MASDGQNTAALTGGGGFFALAASVLCFYEHIITFGEEVRCVWGRRVSGASVLFLLNRYAILVVSLASIVQVLPWTMVLPKDVDLPNLSGLSVDTGTYGMICTVSLRVVDISLVISNLAYTAFASLRMFALYGMSKPVFIFVFVFGLFNPGIQIFRMIIEDTFANWSYSRAINTLPFGRLNCFHVLRERYTDFHGVDFQPITGYTYIALRAHAVIFESMLIVLTWRKTFNRLGLQRVTARTPYTMILLKDGTLYFIVIALASATNMASAAFYVASGAPLVEHHTLVVVLLSASIVVDSITSICMSRFILGLLGITPDNETIQVHTSRWGSLRFATAATTVAESIAPNTRDGFSEEEDERLEEADAEAA